MLNLQAEMQRKRQGKAFKRLQVNEKELVSSKPAAAEKSVWRPRVTAESERLILILICSKHFDSAVSVLNYEIHLPGVPAHKRRKLTRGHEIPSTVESNDDPTVCITRNIIFNMFSPLPR